MNCIICGTELTGKQRMYCSPRCNKKSYRSTSKYVETRKRGQYKLNKFVKKPGDKLNQLGNNNPNWKGGVSKNHMRYRRRFTVNNKHILNVEAKALRAWKSGKIIKMPCQVCDDEKSEMHHPDYSKPFDVIWVCRRHHVHIHYGTLEIHHVPVVKHSQVPVLELTS